MEVRMSKYLIELPNGKIQKIEIPYVFSPHEVLEKFPTRIVFFFLEETLIQKVQGGNEVMGPRWIFGDTYHNKKHFYDAGKDEPTLEKIFSLIKEAKQKR